MSSTTDTNQPDHIVDTHEMVTDTNQASEDELRESIDTLLERWRNILTYKGDGNGDEYYQSDVTDDIQEIIRTEKLKLLAEVRERVVCEYETEYSNLDGDAGYWEKHGRNGMREKQIADLAKLEAEL